MASTERQGHAVPLLQPEVEEAYTSDGSLDIDGNQALKHRTGGWRACRSILGAEFCYCLANNGIMYNLVTYLTTELHQSNVAAAKNVSSWKATCFLTPLAGAVVEDSYWGRYRTMVVACCVGVAGMLMASLSALLPLLIKEIPTLSMASAQEIILFLGLYTIAFGVGGLRPCLMSFGADQFDAGDPSERVSKASLFNWYIFTMNCAAVISATGMVWVQDHCGWGIGLGIPAMVLAIGLSCLVAASRAYRFQTTRGSPLTRVCQVVVAAVHKFNVATPADMALLYELPEDASAMKGVQRIEHTADLRFFDKAAIVTASDEEAASAAPRNPWRLCIVTQVEELKILVRMLPLWASIAFFYTGTAQTKSTFVEQVMAMDARVGSFRVPPASLAAFQMLTTIVLIPLYDRVFVPAARKHTGRKKGIPDLLRIGAGLAMVVLAMVAAATVEMKRALAARTASILWQAPQYVLVGVGELLATVGQLDFFYSQAPPAMKTVCAALGLLAIAAGDYLSSIIVTAVSWATATGGRPGWIPDDLNEGHLDRFFWMMAGLGCHNLVAFTCCAKRYNKSR